MCALQHALRQLCRPTLHAHSAHERGVLLRSTLGHSKLLRQMFTCTTVVFSLIVAAGCPACQAPGKLCSSIHD